MHWNQTKLKGWGRTCRAVCQVCRPERTEDVAKYLEQVGKNGIIARGLGHSYGDQAINDDGAVMVFRRMDRIRSFNEETGELVCEPGVTLHTVTELFSSRGFMAPVTTGSGYHTLGAAVASDMFGTNAHKRGSIAKAVNWIDVTLANGETVRADAEHNPDLFSATKGGMGLTGFISLISLTLPKRPAPNVIVRKERCPDLDTLLEHFDNAKKSADLCYAWIDTLAKGNAIGRGILTTAQFTDDTAKPPLFKMPKIKLPFYLPNFIVNTFSSSMINDIFYRFFAAPAEKIIPYEQFIYPKDLFLGWEKTRGRRGFYQFRFAFSEAEGPQAIRRILTEVSRIRVGSFMATLMPMKEESSADLSFPMKGYCLSLDFIRRHGIEEFLIHLETIAAEHRGRISLQNDALLEPRNLQRMYRKLDDFKKTLATYDPHKKFDSGFARRLGLKGEPK